MSSNRRDFLKATGAAVTTAGLSGVAGLATAAQAASHKPKYPLGKAEHCIMVWLGGGPSQIDTWDPKPVGDPKSGKKKPGGYYPAIDTAIPGVQVCEHLPKCANILDRFNLLRTINHDVIDEHAAATNRMHTGRPTSGTIVYPSIGSIIAHCRGPVNEKAPAYVVIGYPNVTRGPGFLGAQAGYMYLTDTEAGPAALSRPDFVNEVRQARRQQLLDQLRSGYLDREGEATAVADYDRAITEANRLAGPEFMSVFDLKSEPADLRSRYGGEFGQRCLLARRLIQNGVRFLEVSHNLNFVNGTGWDIHNDGYKNQHLLIQEMDNALSTLVLDLEAKKLLDKTLIVVSGEFGRPADFDGGGGRGHWSKAFTVALAGGGLKNGSAIGETDELAQKIVSRPVSVPDLFATMCATLGIDPHTELYDGTRPVPVTDGGVPVAELFS